MSKKKILILVLSALSALVLAALVFHTVIWFCVLPVKYVFVGKPAYENARKAADAMMATSPDTPWEYLRGSFVLDFDGSFTGAPTWVFRYRSLKTGKESVRIYVK